MLRGMRVRMMTYLMGKVYSVPKDYRKLAVYCIAAGLMFSLYDVLFDLALSLCHAAFEWFEFALEELIEHIFHTTRQQTQAIVFYLLLAIGLYVCYRLVLKLTELSRLMKAKSLASWVKYKTRASFFWNHQSTLEKLRLILSGSAGVFVLAFWVFS
jgi:hypothetical protein